MHNVCYYSMFRFTTESMVYTGDQHIASCFTTNHCYYVHTEIKVYTHNIIRTREE